MCSRKTKKILLCAIATFFGMSWTEARACDLRATFRTLETEFNQNSPTVLSGSFCGQSYSISPGLPSTLKNEQTISGTIAGFPFVFTSSVPIKDIGSHPDKTNYSFSLSISGVKIYDGTWANLNNMRSGKTMSFAINGKSLNFSTNASTWMTSSSSNVTTISVDGATLFSGTERQIGLQDILNFLGAIGTLDSGTATQQQVNRTSSQILANTLSLRISNTLSKAMKFTPGSPRPSTPKQDNNTSSLDALPIGLASGEAGTPSKGLWTTVGNTWVRGTSPYLPYTGQLKVLLVGGDMKVLNSSLIGATIGLENNTLYTGFNNGSLDTTGISFSPYYGVSFLDGKLIWNVVGSYGTYTNNTDRMTPGSLAKVTGEYDSRRILASSNIDAYLPIGSATTCNIGAGILGSWDHRNSYTESDNTSPLKNDSGLGEAKATMNLQHTVQGFSGFIGASYLYDFFIDQDVLPGNKPHDRDEVAGKVGFDYAVQDNHTLTVDVTNSFGRSETRATTLMANYRAQF
ncbi:MAG: autotransporter outer membrane beta-barrel domain-containing protein [Magnetococcales bacterium]|nr:autotransporter outer membrane beta-barrel domain-containing protein [Magnetococcales bacterium]